MQLYKDTRKPLNELEIRFRATQCSPALVLLRDNGQKHESFFWEVGHRLKREIQEENAYEYLTQQIAVAVQRGNAASVLWTMGNQQNGLID